VALWLKCKLCAGGDVSVGLHQGFSAAPPHGFPGVSPQRSAVEEPAAQVYVVPIHPSFPTAHVGLRQRTSDIWQKLCHKFRLQKPVPHKYELSVTATLSRERTAELNSARQQQVQRQNVQAAAPGNSETSVFCVCF
jgi:hypothetical protein